MRRDFIKKFIYYLFWTIVIGSIAILVSRFQVSYLETEVATYLVLFLIILPIVIGALLKLPSFIVEIKQGQEWSFDWIKFVAVLLPYLLIMSVSFMPFIIRKQGVIADVVNIGSPTIQIIAGVVLGYILFDSLKKD